MFPLAPSVPPMKEVTQPLWELALIWMGATATTCAFLVIVWKIARPHVQKYIQSVVEPLQKTAAATHEQLVKNGHTSTPATLLDRIDRLGSDLGELSRLSHRNTRKIDSLGESLNDHKSESARRLTEAVHQFSQQGITLHLDDPPQYGDD